MKSPKAGKKYTDRTHQASTRLSEIESLALDERCYADKMNRSEMVRFIVCRELRESGFLISEVDIGSEK